MKSTIEREISVKSILWKILLDWRRWIILGVIFAVLISSLKYRKDVGAYRVAIEQQNAIKQVETETFLTVEEQEAVENAKELHKQIAAIQTYLQDSVLMKIDAYHENLLVLQFYVDSDYTFNFTEDNEKDYSDDVVAAYCNYANSGTLSDEIVNELDINTLGRYINELISTESNNGIFEIYVAYPDDEILEQIKAIIVSSMEKETEYFSETIGSHTLTLLSQQISVRTDTDLARRQKDQRDILEVYRSQFIAAKGAMSEMQLAVLEGAVAGNGIEEKGEADATAVLPEPVYHVKYVVLGGIGGIFLACIWSVLEVLLSGRIQEAEEMSALYGIRLLGEMAEKRRKKRFLAVVDTWILKCKNRNKKQLSSDQQVRLICSNVEIACQKEGINKICLAGSEMEKIDAGIFSDIGKTLKSAEINVYTGQNIIYDADTLTKMVEIGYVVFIEHIGVSFREEIEKEVKISRENGVQIIGSIVIGRQ